jgi:hypothetical protein
MTTLNQSTQSMIEQYKQIDGNGKYIEVIEAMNNTSQYVMDDWSWMECNSGTKHTRSIRTGLPKLAWGALYRGIPQSKSTKQMVDDTTGFIEGLSPVDKRQLDLYADNKAAIRGAEGRSFMEAMAQDLMTSMFYLDSNTNVLHPKGIGARYGKLANSGAGNQIIDAGGTGSDNTSVWMVEWGYDGLSVIYPKGTPAGMTRENKGEQRVLDEEGNPYYVEEELFRTHCGFSLGDWQRCSRVANIDVSELKAGNVDIYKYMRQAYYKLKSRRANKVMDLKAPGRIAIYCNTDVLEALDEQGTNSGSNDNKVRLTTMELQGKEVDAYRKFPIRETDAILNTEARIV